MKNRYILFLILGFDALLLLLKGSELSISYYEASLLYGSFSFMQFLIKVSIYIFGQNDFALRIPMIVLHILSALLLYKISKNYLKIQRNRIWLVLIYILLPGIISSAIIVNDAGLIIFGLFLFVYMYERVHKNIIYLLLFAYLFASGGFVYLFLSLIMFSLYEKDKKFLFFNTILFLLSLVFFGIDAHGSPQGHLLDSIGIYAAVFTPVIFIYLFYVLYRKFLSKDFELLWFIATTALVFSLLLSIRQRVNIEYFAPYLMLSLPLIAQSFEHSYRVRLNIFRKNYRLIFVVSLILLFINSSLVLFNKYLYYVVDEPRKHFSYKMHIVKELASKLNNMNITCIDADKEISLRLRFYGVTKCHKYTLSTLSKVGDNSKNVTIRYKNIPVYSAYVTKLNIN